MPARRSVACRSMASLIAPMSNAGQGWLQWLCAEANMILGCVRVIGARISPCALSVATVCLYAHPADQRHVSGLAETRLARTALRRRVPRFSASEVVAMGGRPGNRLSGVQGPSTSPKTSSLVEQRTVNPSELGSIPKSHHGWSHQEEAGGFPAAPEAPAKGTASGEALCARADTARQQCLSPGSGTGALLRGQGSSPQPDADGGAGSLKPWPATLPWAAAGDLSSHSFFSY